MCQEKNEEEDSPALKIVRIHQYEELKITLLQGLICHKTQQNQILYIWYMYKQDLALNNQQGLICHKTQSTHQPIPYLTKWSFTYVRKNLFRNITSFSSESRIYI